MYACMYVFMYVCMYACMYVCMYACMFVCMHVCIDVCMHVCKDVCMCVQMLQSERRVWQVERKRITVGLYPDSDPDIHM